MDYSPASLYNALYPPNKRNAASTGLLLNGRCQKMLQSRAAKTTSGYHQDRNQCHQCQRKYFGQDICQECRAFLISENLATLRSSGNQEIDAFLKESNAEAIHHLGLFIWIPFAEFGNKQHIANGGFGSVSFAIWYCGKYSSSIEESSNNYTQEVVLKSLKNSQNITKNFLNEITAHRHCQKSARVVRCFGITQHPETMEYLIVMPFAQYGNLREYIRERGEKLTWEQKLEILRDIAEGLKDIHESNLIHCDLHSGNVLHFHNPEDLTKSKILISDLGMCRPADVPSKGSRKQIFGVIQFLAPELLRGWDYSKESDVYAFGGIMYEVLMHKVPFWEHFDPHYLQLDICDGVRPEIPQYAPKCYVNLMKKCWDDDIRFRPSASNLYWTLSQWLAEFSLTKFGRKGTFHHGKYIYDFEGAQHLRRNQNEEQEPCGMDELPFLNLPEAQHTSCLIGLTSDSKPIFGIRVDDKRNSPSFDEYESRQNELTISIQDLNCFLDYEFDGRNMSRSF
ncbi:hypothetical protein G9A89_023474 [Geosiphon pyriformis]|nr:hypothetical protein G9A89_023474 [Geosiphon pyriformis]